MRRDADDALARRTTGIPEDEQPTALRLAHRNVIDHLDLAEAFLSRRMLASPWSASRTTGVWTHIHAARVELIHVLDATRLIGSRHRIRALVEQYLGPQDPTRTAIAEWLEPRWDAGSASPGAAGNESHQDPHDRPDAAPEGEDTVNAKTRTVLAAALQATYDNMAARYDRLRRFQVLVIGGAVALLVAVALVVATATRSPDALPLCFPDLRAPTEEEMDATPATPGYAVCPTDERPRVPATVVVTDAGGPPGEPEDTDPPEDGNPSRIQTAPSSDATTEPRPTSGDIWLVVLFGLIGASLTNVQLVIRRAPPSSVPVTTIRVFQAVLKVATGMLTAVLGLVFLRAGVIPGFTLIDTRSQLVVYAVVFGAAQQPVTGIIDKRSNELLAAVTSTEEEREPGGPTMLASP